MNNGLIVRTALSLALVVGILSAAVATTLPSSAEASSQSSAGVDLAVKTATMSCAQLATEDFSTVEGAATTIASAASVTLSSGGTTSYSYCDVKGKVLGEVGFELLLPISTYQQRYLQEGCEGLCGQVGASTQPSQTTGCAAVSDGAFVIGQDDEGHESAGLGGTSETWASSADLRAQFGYRSEGEFATAAKAIITKFYGASPRYSYYDGCSDGGREALMVVQRYPTMFNGVIAGAPAFNQTALNEFEESYMATIDFRSDGSTILPASKLAILHAAVMKKCADPALHDDTIQDPSTCSFDPVSLKCPGSIDAISCLTAEQVAVVRKAYAGAEAPNGEHLYTGGEPYGSELGWAGLFIPNPGQSQSSLTFYGIGLSFVQWLAGTTTHPQATLDSSMFTVANLKAAQAATAKTYDATDPDLSAFYKAGGKLIMWQGTADQYIPPAGTIAYRQALVDTMGVSTLEKFYRLYMFPGVYHCGGGAGPSTFDLLSPLMNWAEKGIAPNVIIASTTSGGSGSGGPSGGQFGGGPSGAPVAGGSTPSAGPPGAKTGGVGPSSAGASGVANVSLSRPVYPYPERVRYNGHGSTSVAANYVAYTPRSTTSHYSWAGSFLGRS